MLKQTIYQGTPVESPSHADGPRQGFTLVEMVVVVMIIGILALVAVTKMPNLSNDAKVSSVLTNINVIFNALEVYRSKEGEYPANEQAGAFPADLKDYLHESLFTAPTEIGGCYDWNGPGTGYSHYGISIHKHTLGADTASSDFYQKLEKHDDGAAKSGWIRASGKVIYFVLAE